MTFRGHEIDLSHWQRVRLVDSLDEHGLWTRDEAELRAKLNDRGVHTEHDRTWAQLVDHALSHFVEPGLIRPTILYDYPVELSPFARPSDEEGIVERFEYYAGGMELGNAFTEINDSEEQAARFAMQADEGAGGNVEAEPGDPDYVEALSYGMPPTGGLGMGMDRLAMLLLGQGLDPRRDPLSGAARATPGALGWLAQERVHAADHGEEAHDRGPGDDPTATRLGTMITRDRETVDAVKGGREGQGVREIHGASSPGRRSCTGRSQGAEAQLHRD